VIASESSRWRLGRLETRESGIERLAFVATVLFAGATYWLAPRLPMTDLPQHAGQVAVWRDLLLGTSKWQSLLYVNYFTPYLLAYSLGLLATFVLPVSAALKLVLSLAFYGFVMACVALRARLGGDRRLDWLFIPGFFGFANAWGFYTFLVALPFGLFFVLLAHRYAERPTAVLSVALFLADVALFFTHGLVFLFSNGIGGVFLLLAHRRLARLLPAALPYAAAGLLCVLYALVRVRIEAFAVGDPSRVVWDWGFARLNFPLLSISWPERETDWNGAVLLVLMLAAPLALRARLSRDIAAFVPLAATVAVWALVPTMALNTWAIYERFAVFLLPAYAFIFRACDPSTGRGIVNLLWLPVLCWAFLVVHSERLQAFAAESAAFDEVLEAAQPGHRALMLIFDPHSPAIGHPLAYVHFPLWYQAEKGGFVDFNAAGSLPPIVRYRPDRRPPSASPTWEWQHPKHFDWTKEQAEIYRYFFVRSTLPLPPGLFPSGRCRPALLKSAGSWSVFENVNCHSTSS
jgi:hypothetical protein